MAITIPPLQSCVGVLYLVNGKGVPQVHNGKLLKNLNNTIVVQHFTRSSTKKGPMKPELLTFFKSKPKNPPKKWFLLLDVRRTPNFDPLFCSVTPSKGTVIGSGACIGVRFKTSTTQTGEDVKNGKFVYAVDKNGKRLCTIDTKKTLPERIVYMHWNWSKKGAKDAILVPETTSRSNILEVRRNPGTPIQS
jgi:hypothetical protein